MKTKPTYILGDHHSNYDDLIRALTLHRELHDEAARLDRLFELVRPRQWYFGHHHPNATHHRDRCTIRQLDVAELIRHHLTGST